jgi:outer membrane cobalamin receptor
MLAAAMGTASAAAAESNAAEENDLVYLGDPLVITVFGEPTRASEVPFGVALVTAEELRDTPGMDLAASLTRAPGVYIREYGGYGASRTVSLRGAYAKQTLVMVDGEPVNSHQGGDVDFNAISLEDVERLEVMAGPSSALYGANATAGVVNVITRGLPAKPRLSMRGGYGTDDLGSAAVGAGLPLGNFGVNAGGNYRRYGGFRENDDYAGAGGNLKLMYGAPGDKDISLGGHYQESEVGVPGSLTYPSPEARQADRYVNGTAVFNGSWTDALTTDARLFVTNQKRHYTDPSLTTDDTHKNDVWGGRTAGFYEWAAWNRMGLGGEYEREKTVSTSIGDHVANSWAVFGQEDLRFGKFSTVVGARYDKSGVYGAVVSPRAGVRYRFGDAVSVRAAAGRGFRAPTFDELFWPQGPFGGGNPDLKPEYCWTYEAGPTFSWRSRARLELTYFRSDYTDLINGWPPDNVGRALIDGGEGSLDAAPLAVLPGLTTTVAATYLRTKDKDTGEKLDYRPSYTAFGEVKYRQPLGEHYAVTPAISADAVGRQQYTYTDPATYETSTRELAAYTLLGARLGVRLYGAEVYVAGKNLAGKQYQTIYDYPMPGRQWEGGVDFEL